MPIGAKVTLRGEKCTTLDRLITSALPRVRDFNGIKALDLTEEVTTI